MLKQVDLYVEANDPGCTEIMEFLEHHDFKLFVRDVRKNPLTTDEIARLVRHINVRHFLNPSSKAYSKQKLDKSLPERDKIIELMAKDNELLRKPIVVAGRLMVVGSNRHKIMEMLQIKPNGDDPSDSNGDSRGKATGRAGKN